jgi:hypothetical protein
MTLRIITIFAIICDMVDDGVDYALVRVNL